MVLALFSSILPRLPMASPAMLLPSFAAVRTALAARPLRSVSSPLLEVAAGVAPVFKGAEGFDVADWLTSIPLAGVDLVADLAWVVRVDRGFFAAGFAAAFLAVGVVSGVIFGVVLFSSSVAIFKIPSLKKISHILD